MRMIRESGGPQEGLVEHNKSGEMKLNTVHMRQGTVKIKREVSCIPRLRVGLAGRDKQTDWG